MARRIVATAGDLGDNLARFRRSLRAENVSPNTILAYCEAVERLADFLVASELPTDVIAIRRRSSAAIQVGLGRSSGGLGRASKDLASGALYASAPRSPSNSPVR